MGSRLAMPSASQQLIMIAISRVTVKKPVSSPRAFPRLHAHPSFLPAGIQSEFSNNSCSMDDAGMKIRPR